VTSPPNRSPEPDPRPSGAEEQGWAWVGGLTRAEAEQVLDWLEANGYQDRELSFQPEKGFRVRWRP
jgi:hypothetical protein